MRGDKKAKIIFRVGEMVTENGGSSESRQVRSGASPLFARARTGAEPVGSPSGSGARRTGMS